MTVLCGHSWTTGDGPDDPADTGVHMCHSTDRPCFDHQCDCGATKGPYAIRLFGYVLTESGYLTQIASMADASEVTTDGPLLELRDGHMVWAPLDRES